MNANQLLSDEIIPLKTSDTGEEALGAMSDFGVKHFPIVNNEQFLGLISEEDILDYDVEDAIGSYSLSLLRPFNRSYLRYYAGPARKPTDADPGSRFGKQLCRRYHARIHHSLLFRHHYLSGTGQCHHSGGF